MRVNQACSLELTRQQNAQFYRLPNSLISVDEDFKQTQPTLFSPVQTCSSLTANSKINAILIPDYTYMLAKIGKSKNNTKEMPKQDKKVKRRMSVDMEVSPIFGIQWTNMEAQKMSDYLTERSLIQKYLWDQNSKTHSKKYNIVYQQNQQCSPDRQKQVKYRSDQQIFAPRSLPAPLNTRLRHNKTLHCYSIINKPDASPSNNASPLTLDRFQELPSNEVSVMSNNTSTKMRKDITRDTNINVWHTHGLKFGSDVLRMGLRNKNIAIVVHHNNQGQEFTKLRDLFGGHLEQSQYQLEVPTFLLQWSNFIRQSNNKCIIVHLFIKESHSKYSIKHDSSDKCIDIKQIQDRDKEYRIQFIVNHYDCVELGNRDRLLFIVDHLIQKQLQKEVFDRVTSRSYSSIVKRTSKSQSKSAQISRKNSETIMLTPQKNKNKNIPLSIIESEPDQIKSRLPSQIPPNLLDNSNPKFEFRKILQVDSKFKRDFIKNEFNSINLKFKSNKPFFLDVNKKKKKITVISKTMSISQKINNKFSFIQWLCGTTSNKEQNFMAEHNKSNMDHEIINNYVNKPYRVDQRRWAQRNANKRH